MTRYSVTLTGSELDLRTGAGGAITHGGREAGQALLDRIYPSVATVAQRALSERQIGALAAGITGATGNLSRNKEYRNARRYLELVAEGKRRGTSEKFEEYSFKYAQNTGASSSILEQLAGRAANPDRPDSIPSRGVVRIQIKSDGSFYGQPGERHTEFTLPPGRNRHAADDPVGEWLRAFDDETALSGEDIDLWSVNEVTISYDDTERHSRVRQTVTEAQRREQQQTARKIAKPLSGELRRVGKGPGRPRLADIVARPPNLSELKFLYGTTPEALTEALQQYDTADLRAAAAFYGVRNYASAKPGAIIRELVKGAIGG